MKGINACSGGLQVYPKASPSSSFALVFVEAPNTHVTVSYVHCIFLSLCIEVLRGHDILQFNLRIESGENQI